MWVGSTKSKVLPESQGPEGGAVKFTKLRRKKPTLKTKYSSNRQLRPLDWSARLRVVGELFKEGDLNALDLVAEFDSRTEFQLEMLLDRRQRQQHQWLAVDLLQQPITATDYWLMQTHADLVTGIGRLPGLCVCVYVKTKTTSIKGTVDPEGGAQQL